MSQRAIIMSIIIFVLIVGGMFTFAIIKKQELAANVPPTTTPEDAAPLPYPEVTRIDAKHFFIDGVHTLVGELEMPTPCDLVQVTAQVAESYPEQVRVNFEVINTAEFCAQVMTKQRFAVSANASAEATFTASFMGRDIPLNLIPPEPGETPDDFELFIKG